MKRFFLTTFVMAMVCLCPQPTRSADDKDTKAILDKAMAALGGQENLANIKAVNWKTKGKLNFGGNSNDFSAESTAQGLDHYRGSFSGEFSGNKFEAVTVIDGDKGWRNFMGNVADLDADGLANDKRMVYLQLVPMTIVPLLDKGFKVEPAGEEKVNDKPAAGVKVKPPDGKEFTLYFDKESGLPVKQVAKVVDFMGQEFTQETYFGGYKPFGAVKKATKVESKRDGESFIEAEVTDFKVLEKVAPKTFAKPE